MNKKKEYSESFLKFWDVYPKRHRPDDKLLAWKCWQTRMKEKLDPQILISAASEYQTEEKRLGKVGTEFVLSAKTFLGPNERWKAFLPREPAPVPPRRQNAVKTLPDAERPDPVAGRAFVQKLISDLTRAKSIPTS